MARTPTIKITAPTARGWKIINSSDFDPKAHKEFVEPEPVPEKTPDQMTKDELVSYITENELDVDVGQRKDRILQDVLALLASEED